MRNELSAEYHVVVGFIPSIQEVGDGPLLKYAWVESGLQGACNRVTHALRLYKADLEDY